MPHPDASHCRGIVKIQGAGAINALEQHQKTGSILAIFYFRISGQHLYHLWRTSARYLGGLGIIGISNIYRYKSGSVEEIEPVPSGASLRSHLPPLPRAKRPSIEKLKSRNKRQIEEMPWTLGLVEAMGAIDFIDRQNLETKSRISLILLDSNFEIALKEFIVHRTDLFLCSLRTTTQKSHIFFHVGTQSLTRLPRRLRSQRNCLLEQNTIMA